MTGLEVKKKKKKSLIILVVLELIYFICQDLGEIRATRIALRPEFTEYLLCTSTVLRIFVASTLEVLLPFCRWEN